MSLAFENPISVPSTKRVDVLPAPRRSPENEVPVSDDEQAAEARAILAIHRALGLDDDQTIAALSSYVTRHTDRAGNRLPGGELVIRTTVAGQGTEGMGIVRYLEVRDDERAGLDEETITVMGAKALKNTVAERIIL